MNNIFDKFTDGAKRILGIAQSLSKDMGYSYVGSEQLLLAMTVEDTPLSNELLNLGADKDNVLQKMVELVGKGDFQNDGFGYTPRTKKIIEESFMIARNLGQGYVSPEHMLLAILEEGDCVAVAILQELGVNLEALRDDLMQIGSEKGEKNGKEHSDTPMLNKYGVDLTESAKNGELDPVIGRDKEVERIIQILSRRTKNNPVLIGEPGVGKSAIAEGLAQQLTSGNVPEILKDRRLVMLDLASMLAGAKYRGEFEERLKAAIKEVKEHKDIILFIDEIHTLIGTGASEGSMDAANILKPSLARGEIQLIGATTLNEYKKNIEKDAALERRFQPVMVGEPSQEEAVDILLGLRDKYEAHHKVRITDEAIHAAVKLSSRYISDRFLPDKAIDVMDEAASKVRIHSTITPPEIKELEEKIENLKKEKQAAIDKQDYEKAAVMRDKEKEASAQLDELQKGRIGYNEDGELCVTEEDIAKIVSSWTGIPVVEISEDESQRLLKLEETLHQRVVGQDEAVKAVARAIRRARAGLKNPNRPIGSFIFLGPTGVGKTELSKALAAAMFGDESAMIRLDMSEYMEKHAVSKLIGSPPGYVGFEEGGQLTEHVRRKPYSVLLFDEIEKAHPDVFNMLLQILDDGRLTDSQGRTVDFKNTVIIMTSNIGAGSAENKLLGFGKDGDSQEAYEKIKANMMDSLKRAFRPEFLNRVDDIIVFHQLTEEDIRKIVDILVANLGKLLKEREVTIDVSDQAKDWLAKKGYDKEYGARPLKRTIQQEIEDQLSEMILEGSLKLGQQVKIGERDDKLIFTAE